MSEEKKLEGLLREEQKKPCNRTCFECEKKAPTYVNVFNSTFVCDMCAGLLRNFNFRVKSIGQAKFTKEEVQKVQEGGNEAAEKIWMGKWNSSLYKKPAQNQSAELNTFFKEKYTNKKWYLAPGEEKPQNQPSSEKIISSINQYTQTPASTTTNQNQYQQSLPQGQTQNKVTNSTPQDLFSDFTSSTPQNSTSNRPSNFDFPSTFSTTTTTTTNQFSTNAPSNAFKSDPFGSQSQSNDFDDFTPFTSSSSSSSSSNNMFSTNLSFSNSNSQPNSFSNPSITTQFSNNLNNSSTMNPFSSSNTFSSTTTSTQLGMTSPTTNFLPSNKPQQPQQQSKTNPALFNSSWGSPLTPDSSSSLFDSNKSPTIPQKTTKGPNYDFGQDEVGSVNWGGSSLSQNTQSTNTTTSQSQGSFMSHFQTSPNPGYLTPISNSQSFSNPQSPQQQFKQNPLSPQQQFKQNPLSPQQQFKQSPLSPQQQFKQNSQPQFNQQQQQFGYTQQQQFGNQQQQFNQQQFSQQPQQFNQQQQFYQQQQFNPQQQQFSNQQQQFNPQQQQQFGQQQFNQQQFNQQQYGYPQQQQQQFGYPQQQQFNQQQFGYQQQYDQQFNQPQQQQQMEQPQQQQPQQPEKRNPFFNPSPASQSNLFSDLGNLKTSVGLKK